MRRRVPVRRMRIRTLAVVTAIVALSAAAGVALVGGADKATGDDDYLRNFHVAPPKEVIRAEEAANRDDVSEDDISVPDPYVPPKDARPERYGPYLLVPRGWIGPVEEQRAVPGSPTPRPGAATNDLARVLTSPLWDVTYVPDGFEALRAGSPDVENNVTVQYAAAHPNGNPADFVYMDIGAWVVGVRPLHVLTWTDGPNAFRTTDVRGMPAVFWYGKDGEESSSIQLRVFDERSGVEYWVSADALVGVAEAERVLEGMLP